MISANKEIKNGLGKEAFWRKWSMKVSLRKLHFR